MCLMHWEQLILVNEITRKAHAVGAKVLIDGAQSTPHMKVDVKDIDCDFYTFSGHKMYAPSGIGGMFAKMEVMETMNSLCYWRGHDYAGYL